MSDLERLVTEVVEQVGSIQLGCDIRRAERSATTIGDQELLTASIQLSGGFEGAVHVTCARVVAEQAAAVMFDQDAAVLSGAEVRDALGELTNMVAGNLKARLPGDNALSLPTVVEGTSYEMTRLGSRIEAEVPLATRSGPVVIRVWRSLPDDR